MRTKKLLLNSIRERGGHTVSKQGLLKYGQDIVMAFSPPVVVCLVKKGFQEGGVTGMPGPPGYALDEYTKIHTLFMTKMAAKWPKSIPYL